jgi:hypothetical protein
MWSERKIREREAMRIGEKIQAGLLRTNILGRLREREMGGSGYVRSAQKLAPSEADTMNLSEFSSLLRAQKAKSADAKLQQKKRRENAKKKENERLMREESEKQAAAGKRVPDTIASRVAQRRIRRPSRRLRLFLGHDDADDDVENRRELTSNLLNRVNSAALEKRNANVILARDDDDASRTQPIVQDEEEVDDDDEEEEDNDVSAYVTPIRETVGSRKSGTGCGPGWSAIKYKNMGLSCELDVHGEQDGEDSAKHANLSNFLQRRSKVIELVSGDGCVFVLTKLGLCAAFDRVSGKRLCYLNLSSGEVVRSMFYNKANSMLITVSVHREDDFACLKCRSTSVSALRRGCPQSTVALFESEELKWPGFVEFDEINGKVLTYSAKRAVYKVWSLRSYKLLYAISSRNILEIKISPGIILIIGNRTPSHLPLKVIDIETSRVILRFKHLLLRGRRVDLVEQFNEKLLIKQENEDLQIIDIRTKQHCIVPRSKFLTPSGFIFLYEHRLFLAFRDQTVSVWNFEGEQITQFDDHELLPVSSPISNISSPACTSNVYITSTQDIIFSVCVAKRDNASSGALTTSSSSSPSSLVIDALDDDDADVYSDEDDLLRLPTPPPERDTAPALHISSILTGKLLGRISATNIRSADIARTKRGLYALENVSAMFYDEDFNELLTGNGDGFVYVWSHQQPTATQPQAAEQD